MCTYELQTTEYVAPSALAVILVPTSLLDAFASRSYTDAVPGVSAEARRRHGRHDADALVLRVGYRSAMKERATNEITEGSEHGSEGSHDGELLLSKLLMERFVVVECLRIVRGVRHSWLEKEKTLP